MKVRAHLFAVAMLLACLPAAGRAQDSTQLLRQNDPGVTPPSVVKDVKPVYTKEAMDAGLEGQIELEAVVRTDGTVSDVTVVKSLDRKYGLDDQAVIAMKQWLFEPGKKDGKAIPVLITVEMTFTLR
jgi:protein TonB